MSDDRPISMLADFAAALDPCLFARTLGIEPDDPQKELLTTTSRRVLVNACRQFGKSTITAGSACHELIYNPGALVVVVSPSQQQSTELFKKIHTFWQKVPGAPEAVQESLTRMELANGSRVVSLPGTEKTVRGYSGASLIIVDEASRVDDDLIGAVMPMLATTNGSFIALSTPQGRRGFFFEKWQHGGDAWKRIRVPATACGRISKEFLAEQEKTLGPLLYRQEYLCDFVDSGESAFMSQLIEAAMTLSFQPFFMGAAL